MKRRGITGILLLGLILITATACGSADKESTGQQPDETDDIITVSADGNIEATLQTGLTFGSGGKVETINVREGDKVSQGDILAKLDTGALELALSQAEIARTRAEIGVDQAIVGIVQAQAGISQAQIALTNAEIALEFDRKTYSVSDITVAEASLGIAQRNFNEALWVFAKHEPGTPGYDQYQKVVLQAEAGLKAAQDTLDAMIGSYDVKEVAARRLQVEVANQSVELAEQNLKIAEQSFSLAEDSLKVALQSVELVKKQIEAATIIAPFDGTVYKTGVKEGEFISPATYAGMTIVGVVDLSHMELVIRVEEIDIARVKTGQKVLISFDALPDEKFEGRVSYLSPVASDPDGVLLFESDDEPEKFEVKIDFNAPGGSGIRSGMSSTVEIIVE
ncbi:HlyD family secretion protein [Chloroflexota bacterium]